LTAVNHEFNPFAVSLSSDAGKEIIGWDPTRTATEDIDAVDTEEEGLSVLVRLLNDLGGSDTELLGNLVEFVLFLVQGH
jgi:hypothetical protein